MVIHFPVKVQIWDETALYKADWVTIGVAHTQRGLDVLIGKARKRALQWGKNEYDRPFLSTGGPRLGTIRVRPFLTTDQQ